MDYDDLIKIQKKYLTKENYNEYKKWVKNGMEWRNKPTLSKGTLIWLLCSGNRLMFLLKRLDIGYFELDFPPIHNLPD